MAQRGGRGGGGHSEWQRHQQALQREAAAEQKAAEKAAREAQRRVREEDRRKQQEHADQQLHLAEQKTTALDRLTGEQDTLLTRVLDKPPVSFASLRQSYVEPMFDPGRLGIPGHRPQESEFRIPEPRGFGRLFRASYERDQQAALQRYAAAVVEFERREQQRQQALTAAKSEHDQKAAAARARVDEHNADVARRRAAFAQGETEAVDWYITQILGASTYPANFPRHFQVAYRPENGDVVVEMELPPQAVIPPARAYKYVKARDAIDPVPRLDKEIKQRYATLIAQVALRTLHEIFSATPHDVIDAVVFNGRVTTTDRATGRQVRPHLLSVSTTRQRFSELVLAKIDPAACLKHLNALVSPNPFDLEAVEPFIEFDLSRFRFMDNLDVADTLDSRRNLLKLSPTEFEHLIRELFVAMGAEAWNTIPSKDGGVDAVATSNNLFFGGVCLIQAKRYTGIVGLEATHALTGVMTDHNATTGVLVTTSWFGRASEEFAKRNRITLINGAELKHLIKQHLGIDVIPGTKPPQRRPGREGNS